MPTSRRRRSRSTARHGGAAVTATLHVNNNFVHAGRHVDAPTRRQRASAADTGSDTIADASVHHGDRRPGESSTTSFTAADGSGIASLHHDRAATLHVDIRRQHGRRLQRRRRHRPSGSRTAAPATPASARRRARGSAARGRGIKQHHLPSGPNGIGDCGRAPPGQRDTADPPYAGLRRPRQRPTGAGRGVRRRRRTRQQPGTGVSGADGASQPTTAPTARLHDARHLAIGLPVWPDRQMRSHDG